MALMIILSIIPLCSCGYIGNNSNMHKWQKTYGHVWADLAQAIDQTYGWGICSRRIYLPILEL